ncbi:MAG: Rad52/Rad22 family DNA repair protein [Thermodesulfobacteriota bacterium]|nr:Rad52/Rad22 family DNA repair protein [Thermodesulfobacteriota bacterium]
MNRELLEQPFNQEQIKQRAGNFGNTLDYVEGHSVIQRLNDSLEGKWSFEIVRHEILQDTDEVLVVGKLVADNITKMQFGSSRITRAKGSGEVISISDDLKAAATDALKKTATQLGVGLHLYAGKHPSKDVSGPRNDNNSPHRKSIYCGNFGGSTGGGGASGGVSGSAGGGGNEGSRVTNRQLDYILNLGSDIGLDSKGLDKESLRIFGTKLAYITTKDASALINTLKREAA